MGIINLMLIRDNFPLNQTTTLKIGGPAKKFAAVKTDRELIEAINCAKENSLEFLAIGGGSNLLVSDKGVDKLIIKNEIIGISKKDDMIIAKSGTILQDLVDYAINNGLAGLQKLAGIPGTLGGAVFGNAGAYGQTISDHIVRVKVYDGEKVISFSSDQCKFNYRDSSFKKNHFIILAVTFKLVTKDTNILKKESVEIMEQRLKKYHPGLKCPGSFFKNIVANSLSKETLSKIPSEKITYGKIPAGYLLESVGAKGQKLGKIEVASYHGNLFINTGRGSAKDFYELAKSYFEKVKEKYGITLEPEVQLINLPPFE